MTQTDNRLFVRHNMLHSIRIPVLSACLLLAVGVRYASSASAIGPPQDDGEHGSTLERSLGAFAWGGLPDAQRANVHSALPAGLLESRHALEVADYEFVLLPDVGLATDINNQRQIVGLDILFQGGVLIDHGVVTPINFPGSIFTEPTNINERGVIIGLYADEQGTTRGFRRDADGEYMTIEIPGAARTTVWGLNDAGDIVGDFFSEGGPQIPFLLNRHGEFAMLDVPGDASATALGINNQGTISGWFLDENSVSQGYLLENDGTSVINYPGADSSDVGRVNNSGELNGIYFTFTAEPPFINIGSYVRSKQGEFFDVSFPGWESTLIRGINDRGDQAGAVLLDMASPPQGFVALRR